MPRKPPSVLEVVLNRTLDMLEDSGIIDAVYDALNPPLPPRQKRPQTARKRVGGQAETPRRSKPPKPPHAHVHTHYDTLQVSRAASQEVIQGAFRSLSRVYHPDVPRTGSKTRMQTLNEAYSILSDPTKKRKYDLTLR